MKTKAATSASNRRNFTRWEVDLPCKLSYNGHKVNCRLHDISEGGGFVETGAYVPKGQRIEVVIESLADQSEVRLAAKVRHVGMLRGTDILGLGIEFESLPLETFREVERLIRRIGAMR